MQRVGHSDKVILYRGTRNLRYFCYLVEKLDLEILKEATYKALDHYDFFKRKAIKIDGVFFYEEDNEPICFLPYDDKQLYLGTEETNNHLFVIKYTENMFVLSMFHSISDFFGSWQFFRTIIYNYSKMKGYDVPAFDNSCEHLENMDDEEKNDPYKKFANKNANKTYEYKDGDNIYVIPKELCNPNNFRRTDVVAEIKRMIEVKNEFKTSFAPAITYLLTESVQKCFGIKDQVIVSKFPLDMRKPVGTLTPVNFSDAMFLSLTEEDRNNSPIEACNKIKKDILAQTTKENCELLMYAGIENANKLEGSLKEKTLDLHFPKSSFTITYPGNLSLPKEYENIVKDVQLDSLSFSDSLRVVVYTYEDKITFTILQDLIDDRYVIALANLLKEYGFNPTVEEKGTIKGDLFDDKRIK